MKTYKEFLIEDIKLYLDDVRTPPPGWVLAKSVKEAIKILQTNKVSEISLDHDLGGKKTGQDVINWIEMSVVKDNFIPPKVMKVHSANPVGIANINATIKSIKKRIK